MKFNIAQAITWLLIPTAARRGRGKPSIFLLQFLLGHYANLVDGAGLARQVYHRLLPAYRLKNQTRTQGT